MPRKSKPRKVKNIIQQVIVNVSDVKKKSTRKRRPRKRVPKEAEDIMARVAPSIVYFQAPSVNLPAPFSTQVPRTLSESVAKEPYVKASEPIKISQPNDSLDKIGDNISEKEFAPTANFISTQAKLKAKSIIARQNDMPNVFEEPPVFGNTRFSRPKKFERPESIITERLYEPANL